MEFGEWVQKVRKERRLDVRTFAEKTGVDPSTISRIENLKTEATFYTAFRIIEAMGASPIDLFAILTGKLPHLLVKRSFKEESKHQLVTLQDVEKFVNDFVSDKDSVCRRLAEDLNYLSAKYASRDKIQNREWVAFKMSAFTSGDIDRILFTSSLYYRLELKYPTHIRADDILFTYEQNGALLLNDVEVYLQRLDPHSNFAFVPLSRMMTSSSIERIKLSDVLQFDVKSEQDGRIIGMFWEVCKFYERFNTLKQQAEYSQLTFFDLSRKSEYSQLTPFDFAKRSEFDDPIRVDRPNASVFSTNRDDWGFRLAVIYVTINRWYQYYESSDYIWKL
jgi:transcriptional regulator with XRE-family HTH domain